MLQLFSFRTWPLQGRPKSILLGIILQRAELLHHQQNNDEFPDRGDKEMLQLFLHKKLTFWKRRKKKVH